MKFKIVSLVLASIFMLAVGFAYAKPPTVPPGHELEKGQGHENHQGNGFGHYKNDVSPS